MIVKKMPILQGFPDFETVKFFTGKFFQKYNFTPVFYDIETTGLSRNSTYLYLIGAVGIEDETWNFYQWMAENASEEETILRIFSQFLQQYNLMISYNGERFDQPYLEARYEKYGIPSPFTGKQSLDLYLTLKPLKSLLKLSAMKQPCMEEFLGIKVIRIAPTLPKAGINIPHIVGARYATAVPAINVKEMTVEILSLSCWVCPSSGISALYGVQYAVMER